MTLSHYSRVKRNSRDVTKFLGSWKKTLITIPHFIRTKFTVSFFTCHCLSLHSNGHWSSAETPRDCGAFKGQWESKMKRVRKPESLCSDSPKKLCSSGQGSPLGYLARPFPAPNPPPLESGMVTWPALTNKPTQMWKAGLMSGRFKTHH